MGAGSRSKLVSIKRRTSAQDSVGQTIETWTETASVWASVEPITGREYFNASGERAEVTHKVGILYGPTVVPRDRIEFDSRVFDIKSVMNIQERNRELVLMCSEFIST